MFIKYNEADLLSFFEKEPIAIGDYDAGELLYTFSDSFLKVVMLISTYEQFIKVSIVHCEKEICDIRLDNVVSIEYSDNVLRIYTENEHKYVLKKNPIIGIVQE